MKSINHLCAPRQVGALAAAVVLFAASQAGAQEAEGPQTHWYDAIHVGAFVDTYASLNLNFPKPETGQNLFRGNDISNGFAMAWAGLDVVYDAAPVGATLMLRFGPQAPLYAQADAEAGLGLEYVRQAFVTWKPTENLSLDFGKWDTFAGAEAIDSQGNMNYTRGVLHWLGQPTFHTGLRVNYVFNDQLSMLAFVANGTSMTIDNNSGKTFGYQVSVNPTETLGVSLGYIGGPEQPDTEIVATPEGEQIRSVGSANKRWRHVVDLIATFDPRDDLSVVLNADLGFEDTDSAGVADAADPVKWFGVMAGVRYAFNENLAVAYRGEVYFDPDGYTSGLTDESDRPLDLRIITNTLTLEASPTPNLIFKLDGRIDLANEPIYPKGLDETRTILPTITLGVVAKTD